MAVKLNMNRRFIDPTALTPYEERILELVREGKTFKEVATEMGATHAYSISRRFRIIKEKLEANEHEQRAQNY